MKTKIVIVLLFATFFITCQKESVVKVKYEIKKYNYNYGNCDSTSAGCVELKAEYPVILETKTIQAKDSINSTINNYLLSGFQPDSKFESLEKFAAYLTEDFKKFKSEFPDAPVGYAIENNIQVISDTLDILTISFQQYSFMGGAHPNSTLIFENFDLNTGKKLSVEDVFLSDKKERLNKIAEAKFRVVRGLTESEDLEKAGFWFTDNKFTVNNNFGITKKGIVFYYNSYEVAPYALGQTEVLIPYNELKSILNPKIKLN